MNRKNRKSSITTSAPGILFLLALLLAASPSGGQAPGQLCGSATVWDEVPDFISITAPADIEVWTLAPGIVNLRSGTLKVDASGPWTATVRDEDPRTSGRLTKYDGGTGTYDTDVKLHSPLVISASSDGGNEVVLSPVGQEIISGVATAEGGRDVRIDFKQPVGWNDLGLENGSSYRLVVTFTGSLIV
ncbi:MAG: hypothetical protein PHN90_09750 [Methanothrix sp.]|nr:hypothetical protein [Methanothrix sp.]MDI9399127.1 hypothetical protein [Euryarchaeota archaeon]